MKNARQAGKRGEQQGVAWLRSNGFPTAERRLSGAVGDIGDITSIGPGLVIDMKNTPKAFRPAEFIDQLLAELDNADADHGVMIIKRRGKTDVGEWYALTTAANYVDLLRTAGYGDL